MTANVWFQLAFYVVVLIALAKPLGADMARVYEGRPTRLDGLVRPLEWYGTTVNVFYNLTSQWRFGTRLEWFRDEQGTRTAQLGRPGFAAHFFDSTVGVTYKPHRSVMVRPELRVDWSPDARPYTDQTSKVQFVPAIDPIVRF